MFYILDCAYKVVGNAKGYRTHNGAMCQARHNKAISMQIESNYIAREVKANNHYFSVRSIPTIAKEA
jgi:hypothetical protein